MSFVVSQRVLAGHAPVAQRKGTHQPHARQATLVVRASSSELKKPELRKPELSPKPEQPASSPEPKKLFNDGPVEPTIAGNNKVVTIEYQRQRAKEMTKYFTACKLEEQTVKAKKLGWTPDNEINNGRWVMFGLAVGLLTEYATGVDFINQLGLIVSYLGIADLD